jgi:hypothetical protein
LANVLVNWLKTLRTGFFLMQRNIYIINWRLWPQVSFVLSKTSHKPRSLAAIWIVFSCVSSISIPIFFQIYQELFFLRNSWRSVIQNKLRAFKARSCNLLLYQDAETIATTTTTLLSDRVIKQEVKWRRAWHRTRFDNERLHTAGDSTTRRDFSIFSER